MAKSFCAVLLLLTTNFGNIFVNGQSTVGDNNCYRDEQDIVNVLSRVVRDLNVHNSDAWIALTKSIQSEFQNLKAQVTRLENRVERHDTYMNNSLQVNRRRMQAESIEIKNEFRGLKQKLSSRHCPTGFNYSVAGFSKCYAILNDKVNWTTAQQKCRQLHSKAQLAVIMNSREGQITSEIIREKNCAIQNRAPDNGLHMVNGFWIGAHRVDISNCNSTLQWSSSNGASFPIQYSNWAFEEPNCGWNVEACASINKYYASKWNDLFCTWFACPLCEVTIYV